MSIFFKIRNRVKKTVIITYNNNYNNNIKNKIIKSNACVSVTTTTDAPYGR